jgi:hypothetical protein
MMRASARVENESRDHKHGSDSQRLGEHRGSRLSGGVVHGVPPRARFSCLKTIISRSEQESSSPAKGSMTPTFLRRTPHAYSSDASPHGEYRAVKFDHQCGGILSRAFTNNE